MTHWCSAETLKGLPMPSRLERACQAAAALDAILMPEWQFRYYSYDPSWSAEPPERWASMRDGGGERWDCVFTPTTAFLKAYARWFFSRHSDAPRSPLRLLEQIPEPFRQTALEPAFDPESAGLYLWWDGRWEGFTTLPDPDRVHLGLLSVVSRGPAAYADWAETYFERPIPLSIVQRVWDELVVHESDVAEMNPDADVRALLAELEGMHVGVRRTGSR